MKVRSSWRCRSAAKVSPVPVPGVRAEDTNTRNWLISVGPFPAPHAENGRLASPMGPAVPNWQAPVLSDQAPTINLYTVHVRREPAVWIDRRPKSQAIG